jgi:hypothetical protein
MKERRITRKIQIPESMEAAISGLALKHNRDMEAEIEFLVRTALEREAKTGEKSDPAVIL